jgi:hypothetical protein
MRFSADELAALRQALPPVHRYVEVRIGKPLIDAVYRIAAALGYKMAR